MSAVKKQILDLPLTLLNIIERESMNEIDMSSEAITRRLRQTDQLRALSLSLMRAKNVSDGKPKAASRKDKRKEKIAEENF